MKRAAALLVLAALCGCRPAVGEATAPAPIRALPPLPTALPPLPAPTLPPDTADLGLRLNPAEFALPRGREVMVNVSAVRSVNLTLAPPEGVGVRAVPGGFAFVNREAPNGELRVPLTATDAAGGRQSALLLLRPEGGPALRPFWETEITPGAAERELLELLNELRTRGTVNGDADARRGSCWPDFTPLHPWAYHGALHLAARGHAAYLQAEIAAGGTLRHEQTNRANPFYTGTHPWDRSRAAARAFAYPPTGHGENLALGQRSAADAVRGWLLSPSHCALLRGEDRFAGTGGLPSARGPLWVLVTGR